MRMNDHNSNAKGANYYERKKEMLAIIAYIKKRGEAVPTADVCRDLKLKASVPGFVAHRFPSSLVKWRESEKGRTFIDLHPHLWAQSSVWAS